MGKLTEVETLSKHSGRVWNISWHPKGQILASCGEDKIIRIWGRDGNKWVIKLLLTEGHLRTIREVSWSPCGDHLASASFDGTTCIWDRQSLELECNATLEGHENEVKSVSWSASGRFLATCSRDKSVWIWEVAEEDEYECAAVLNAHNQDVKKVVWHPNQDILASASYDNTIKLFKEDALDNDWICFATLKGHELTVWSISWNKTGDCLASCSDDCTIKIWKEFNCENNEGIPTEDGESNWKCICTISGYHTRTIYDICWNKENDLIATASGDDSIRIFQQDSDSDPNAPNFSQVACVERAHLQDVNCVKWNPIESNLLASCSDDGDIKLWTYSD